MAGVTTLTAAEIFTNPDDLSISIGGVKGGKLAFTISRGPGHCYKPLLSTPPVFETREALIVYLGDLLTQICQAMTETFSDPRKSIFGSIFNPDGRPASEMQVLTVDRVQEMMTRLRVEDEVTTTPVQQTTIHPHE